MDDNLPYLQKIFVYFFDLGEISRFDSFLTVKNSSKLIYSLKSKKGTEIFFEYVTSYLLGISSKIGGEWGNMDFFGIDVLFFDDHFWQDEVDKSKSFFLKI